MKASQLFENKHIMKILFFVASLLCIAPNLRSQWVEIPFYEPFENDDFDYRNSIQFWQIQEWENDRISSVSLNPNYSNSLKITVTEDDRPAMDTITDGRSRAEIAQLGHKIKNNDVFYYSWDLFIPSREKFIKESGATDDYYVIMQWHEDGSGTPKYCYDDTDEDSPDYRSLRTFPVSLRLFEPEKISSQNAALKLKIGTTYGPGPCDQCKDKCPKDPYSRGFREYIIDDGVKLGEWNHIVTQIKWSYDGDTAFIRMWINELPVINDRKINEYVRCDESQNPHLYLGNGLTLASTLGGVPLMYSYKDNNDSTTIAEHNYIKFGHYRKRYTSTNTIYIDNYRITREYPPKVFETFLTDNYCNKALKLGSNYEIVAHELSPVDQYRFSFDFNTITQQTDWITSNNNKIDLLNYNWILADKTYLVKVRALNNLNNGNGFEYGKDCNIKTPKTTTLKQEFCSDNILDPYIINSDGVIDCYPLPGATDYLYRLTNVSNANDILWYPSNANGETSINVFDLYGLKANTTYKVEIRARRYEGEYQVENDTYIDLGYGTSCYIKINSLPITFNAFKNKVIITPNPIIDNVNIKLYKSEKIIKVEILNLEGKVALTKKVDSNSLDLYLGSFKKGIYQLIVTDMNGKNYFEKLIIK